MSLAAKKDVYGTFSNDSEWVQVIYDFSVDGGASVDYDVLEAKEDLVVIDFYYDVQTAVTSGGSLVMDLGIGDGGTEFISDTAVATMVLNYVAGMDTARPVKVASGSKIVMGFEAADALTGKIAFNFLVKKV